MSAIIEVASIRPPREARKPGHVIAADGAAFECWPEKLNKLQVGERYAVEVETREWQGRPIRKIVKAQPFRNGAFAEPPLRNGGSVREPPERSGGRDVPAAEQAFVASIVSAFIAAGKVGLDSVELDQAVSLARALWRCTLGGARA
jgi:hypothetical protein